MLQLTNGSVRLTRFAGVDVFVHWSWLLVALVEIQARQEDYNSPIWNVVEYLSLFGIVLLHEFGHALACRQVGGVADRIVLWPLGGIAFVSPPPRPGAVLWSIAAGPLVNVALLPITIGALAFAEHASWEQTLPDLYQFVLAMTKINAGLLIFNLLPVYPLDGGQILQALLWFVIGRARALLVATSIGLVGVAALIGLALFSGNWWLAFLAAFLGLQCWLGFKQGRAMSRAPSNPRQQEFGCPSCGNTPPQGPFWLCRSCSQKFDVFASGGACPNCGSRFHEVECAHCRQRFPLADWLRSSKP